MRYGSTFSGLGGIDLAFDRAGWRCAFQAERDPQCIKVLEKHWPDVPRFTDVCDVTAAAVPVQLDALVGGFPCQDLSVAGRRAGLAGKRSGLFWEFARIAGEFRPRWILLENVPGLLSSNEGRDMRAIVDALVELGYGWAYRVTDAQWFGVPQRRRRVFIVGCLGDFRRAAAVLFERESLPWDTPPRREKGARVAAGLTSGSAAGSGVNRPGRRCEDDVNLSFGAQSSFGGYGHDMPTLRAEGGDCAGGVPFAIQERAVSESETSGPGGKGYQADVAYTLESRHHQQNVATPSMVRRLMPVECQRLQGLPDDWFDGLNLSDSAKYRMCGNSVAVPCVEWIARRMNFYHQPSEATP